MHTELARRLRVQPATITKMLDRMEKAGFLERRPDSDDQRVSRVYLTEAGRAVQAGVQQVWRQLEDEAFAGFTLEERVLVRRFFLHIRDNLMGVTGGAGGRGRRRPPGLGGPGHHWGRIEAILPSLLRG